MSITYAGGCAAGGNRFSVPFALPALSGHSRDEPSAYSEDRRLPRKIYGAHQERVVI